MPQQGNLTAKKFDGTTAVTLTAITPSGGQTPALWSDLSSGTADAFRVHTQFSFKKTGDGRAKRVSCKTVVPQVVEVDGVPKVVNTTVWETSGVVPLSMPESAVKDAFAIHISAQLPAAGSLATSMATGTSQN